MRPATDRPGSQKPACHKDPHPRGLLTLEDDPRPFRNPVGGRRRAVNAIRRRSRCVASRARVRRGSRHAVPRARDATRARVPSRQRRAARRRRINQSFVVSVRDGWSARASRSVRRVVREREREVSSSDHDGCDRGARARARGGQEGGIARRFFWASVTRAPERAPRRDGWMDGWLDAKRRTM